MKKILEILVLLLMFNLLFPYGERKNQEFTIIKYNEFTDIKGWKKNNGIWKSWDNEIKKYYGKPLPISPPVEQDLSLQKIEFYQIKENEELLVLKISQDLIDDLTKYKYRRSYLYLLKKEDMINNLKFESEKFNIIMILTQEDSYIGTNYNNIIEHENKVREKIQSLVYEYTNREVYLQSYLCIPYYVHNNKIQYLIGERINIGGWGNNLYDHSLNFVDFEDLMKEIYFESQFDRFESFFKSPLN